MSGTPPYEYRPNFIAGSTPCEIPYDFREIRSRINAGGSFFRSYNANTSSNGITIKSTWEYNPGSGYISTTNSLLIERVKLNIVDTLNVEFGPLSIIGVSLGMNSLHAAGNVTSSISSGDTILIEGSANNGIYLVSSRYFNGVLNRTIVILTETLPSSSIGGTFKGVLAQTITAPQSFIPGVLPLTECDFWSSGISSLRSQINSSSTNIIQMPNRPSICNPSILYDDIIDSGTALKDSSHLNFFDYTNLIGGDGPPEDGALLSSIRTGPERSLIILQATEFDPTHPNKGNGDLISPDSSKQIKQWDGFEWIPYIP